MREIKVLVMSVGVYAGNKTARYIERIGGTEHLVVCLPKQFQSNADSYRCRGIEVYIYDESKFINADFEFFGFKPRNCGGVGRQGIAEATELYREYICFQLDDDYNGFRVCKEMFRTIRNWNTLQDVIYLFNDFYNALGIEIAARTGATPPKEYFLSNRKIFNNFIMRPGSSLNYEGFAALCSDDVRYNVYRNILELTPMVSVNRVYVGFSQNQGDRPDGNAVIYNTDCSWKKCFSLKMMFPWVARMYVSRERHRVLFRETLEYRFLYPPICLTDPEGVITSYVVYG